MFIFLTDVANEQRPRRNKEMSLTDTVVVFLKALCLKDTSDGTEAETESLLLGGFMWRTAFLNL